MRAAIRSALSLPPVRPAAWAIVIACATTDAASAKAPGVTPPPRRPKPAATPAGASESIKAPFTNDADALLRPAKAADAADATDAKVADAKEPAAPRPEAAARPEVPPVPIAPADGPLSRNDLIQLAIQAHPDFWRFRGEVAFFLQAEEAAYDWRDPELRIGFDHEFEQDLGRPYEESRSIQTTETGVFDNRSGTSFTSNDGSGDLSGIFSGSQSQSESVSQTRNITTEVVEKRTPGKYQDVIERTVYEVERRDETRRQNERGPGSAAESSTTDEYSRRRVVSRSREYRNHPNDLYGDEQFSVQARLFIPNPWEVKARAARARAEADLSSKRLQSEVRTLVFDVGRRYDELQFRYAWHQANQRLLDLMQRNLKAVEEQAKGSAGAVAAAAAAGVVLFDPIEIPRARLEINKAREEVFDSDRELALVREELGLLCGLSDPSRILLTNTLRLRKISENDLDQAALVELARAHRPDLGEMQARGDIERARLREVKALRLPWINDLRVGWARTSAEGYRDQDELTALLSVNLPLFSWWQNKSHRQHEEAIARFEEARSVLGERIDGQVAFAIRAVRGAAAALSEFSRTESLLREDIRKNEADAAATTPDKAARIRLATEEAGIKAGRGRLQALYHYNQAVAHLELALGLPLEEAFAPASPKAPAAR